jgi:HD-GYP domain-containing protein (c-di-GMP phosphodiesterase class II)
MPLYISTHNHPVILKIHGLLHKIDRLQLPASSRRDVESILVRQVSKEIDRALPWQAGHGRRTAAIALMIGRTLALDTGEVHALRLASLLHDIGLLTVPLDLLVDRHMLEPDAYAAIQSHPRIGASLLEPFSFLRQASILVAHHHERWNGSGYPYGLRGTLIPNGSRILALADAFDAIEVPGVQCSARRQAIALRIVQVSAGSQFDPELVKVLVRSVTDMPREHHAGAGEDAVSDFVPVPD